MAKIIKMDDAQKKQAAKRRFDHLAARIAKMVVHQVAVFAEDVPDEVNVQYKGQALLEAVVKKLEDNI